MLKKIFTVFDHAAEAYLQPFFLDTAGQAIRTFTEAVNDPNHPFGKYPKDYTLFHIGTYDESNGHFDSITPQPMGNALEYQTHQPSNVTQLPNSDKVGE